MDARRITGVRPNLRGRVLKELLAAPPAPVLSAEQVYHDYAPRVFNVARRMVATDIDAEDVTQDVLLQVVRKLPSFRGEAAFPTWLHRVTVNTALSYRRQAGRRGRGVRIATDLGTDDQTLDVPTSAPPPDGVALSAETRRLLEEAVARLPLAYRSVFVMADVEGLPNAEIAERLDMSLPAVKSRLHRARAMLREELAPHFEDVPV
jgi:RNA polymerase sigma-70 factor (ECF subfamily)